MAAAVVQTVRIETTSGASVTVVGGIIYTLGNLANACVSVFGGALQQIVASDLVNGSYTGHTGQGSAAGVACRILEKPNITGGLTNLTAGGGAGTAGVVGVFREISGADAVSPFDQESGFTSAGSAAPGTGARTNSKDDSIYVAILGDGESANPVSYTINAAGTVGTWIENDATNCKELNGSSFPAMGTVSLVVSTRASRGHVWATTSTQVGAALAIYRAAGPNISAQPAQQTVVKGATATFNITATGTGTVHYQWKKNGSNVGTDTNSYTTAATVNSDTLSTIQCVVTDDVGTTNSDSTYLVVIQAETDWLHTA